MVWIKWGIINMYTMLAVMPFISFFILLFIFKLVYKDNKKSLFRAADITTIFLIGSVSVMINVIFNVNFGFWLIVLLFLLFAGFIGSAQNRLRGRVDAKHILKLCCRVGFLSLSFLYILFLIIGIIKYIYLV